MDGTRGKEAKERDFPRKNKRQNHYSNITALYRKSPRLLFIASLLLNR